MENLSSILVFTLSGFNEITEIRYMYLSITILCYVIILWCNITIIFTVILNRRLHEPMYIFLCSLCINALYGTAGFYPKFMFDLLSKFQVISYAGCLSQTFVIYTSVLCDFSTLTIMAYDRYVAICKPLEYHSKITNHTVIKCIIFSWLAPFFCMGTLITLSARLTLCGSVIEKLYCENWAVVKLSCFSVTVNNAAGYFVIIIYFCHALFIFCSYIRLIDACQKSAESRSRFMQTCIPHMAVLLNFTVALLFDVMYSRYGSTNFPQGLRNFLALEFLIIPPIVNPIIYGLKLSKVRKHILRLYLRNNVSRAGS
ncbi:olfactory receptor 52E8-like [Chanos chanos]|uniref:Olfactory receptor 52E8-like n=1 Tax=Chanos chanos TaxID=29144 RepID=A0A6J2VIH8_CHACN|nr:olfactory receptor 52E8-like [Chanos chanos]